MVVETLVTVVTFVAVVALLVVLPLVVVRGVGGTFGSTLDADWRATQIAGYEPRPVESGVETLPTTDDEPLAHVVDRPRPRG